MALRINIAHAKGVWPPLLVCRFSTFTLLSLCQAFDLVAPPRCTQICGCRYICGVACGLHLLKPVGLALVGGTMCSANGVGHLEVHVASTGG